MAGALSELAQGAWSSGIVRATARDRIPKDGAYDIRDGLLDDDGNVYQRGAVARLTSNQMVGNAVAALFEGQFSSGRRLFGIAGNAYAVMNAAGTAWTALGFASAVTGGGLVAQLGDLMFIPTTSGGTIVYAGSQQSVAVNGGATSVSVTAGSATVTGSGTSWTTTNIDPGSILRLSSQLTTLGVVKSVDSNTQITLTAPWSGATASGASYIVQSVNVLSSGTYGLPTMSAVAAVGGRFLYAVGRRVVMSSTVDPTTGASRPLTFGSTDFHEFPADVVGLAVLRDRVFVFTKAGIFVISNATLDIVDALGNAQQSIEKLSGDVIARSPGGFAYWRDSLVFVAIDGVYLLSASGQLELLSRNIGPLLRAHVDAGHTPGQMITFRDHVFVPVGGDLFVGRLDRRVKNAVGESAPWVRFVGGDTGTVQALAVQDPYGTPRLVAGQSSTGYLLDMTGVFASAVSGSAAVDPVGSYSMVVETREVLPAEGNVVTVRDVVVDYVLGNGSVVVATEVDGGSYASLSTTPGVNSTDGKPRVVNVGRSARRIALQLTFTGSAGSKLRAVQWRSRLRGMWR